jgi:hypothetical protein
VRLAKVGVCLTFDEIRETGTSGLWMDTQSKISFQNLIKSSGQRQSSDMTKFEHFNSNTVIVETIQRQQEVF